MIYDNKKDMKALDYQFPMMNKANMVFPIFDSPPILLKEAKERGFYNGDTDANRLFKKWFFGGIEKTPEFKKGVDEAKAQRAMNWAICFMRSFAPKHEEKEAICALIFSEALEEDNVDSRV